ncbi:MAG: catechol 1,2-dioxygenase [Dehalococcoidia bacterium]|nr:catechol 1,2-dioxygenase [Dehalococcoidia bacterium]
MTQGPMKERATAAASGTAATLRFFADRQGLGASANKERVNLLATEILKGVHETIRSHKVTYDEYDALKAWLISVGQDGEWPLFLDVFVEHVVEEVANAAREGTKGSIEGPYYVPNSPLLPAETALPMRPDEAGTRLLFRGQVTNVAAKPLAGARLEMWHADHYGLYSQFAEGIPDWNLRGTIIADEEGRFRISTIQPAPYQIPTDGACGRLIAAAGWHAWRPAHLHLLASADGYSPVLTQLFFKGDQHLEDDIASAVKPDLILDPAQAEDGTGLDVTFNFVLAPA